MGVSAINLTFFAKIMATAFLQIYLILFFSFWWESLHGFYSGKERELEGKLFGVYAILNFIGL